MRKAAAALIAVLAPVVALYGWGREGHRIIADIAQERLTEVTKRNVQSLLGNNTLASVANWMTRFAPSATRPTTGTLSMVPRTRKPFPMYGTATARMTPTRAQRTTTRIAWWTGSSISSVCSWTRSPAATASRR